MLKRLRITKISTISYLFLIATLIFTYFPLIKNIEQPIQGWGRYYILATPLSQSLSIFHQLPFRTYLFSGGYPVIGDIEGWNTNPLGVFIALFKEIMGVKLIVLIYLLTGALGMFYLTKNLLKYNHFGAVYSSVLFILCPWFAYRIIDSDIYYLSICFLPFLISFFIKSFSDSKYLPIASIFLSFYILSSGLNFIIVCFFILLFTVLKTFNFIHNSSPFLNYSYLKKFILLILFSLLLSSIKILPMIDLIHSRSYQYFHNSPAVEKTYGVTAIDKEGRIKETISERCFTVKKLYDSLFKKNIQPEYLSIYFGYIPVFLLLIALLAYFKESIIYFILLLFFIILMFGPNNVIDIYKPLWDINSFTRGIVKPDKYFLPYIFFLIALIAGQSFSLINRFKKTDILKYLFITLAIISIYEISVLNHSLLNRISYLPKEKIHKINNTDFFQIEFYKRPDEIHHLNKKQNDDFWFYPLFQQNIGIVNFYPTIDIAHHAIPKYFINKQQANMIFNNITDFSKIEPGLEINSQYKGEVYFQQKQNQANLLYFSSNKIIIDTKIITPDKLIINQNYHNGWKSNKGKMADYNGLLSIDIDKKTDGLIKLTYFPHNLLIGLIASLLGIVVIYVYLSLNTK